MGSRSNDGRHGPMPLHAPDARGMGLAAKSIATGTRRLADGTRNAREGLAARSVAMTAAPSNRLVSMVRQALAQHKAKRLAAIKRRSDEVNRHACLRIVSARERLQDAFGWGFLQHDMAVRLGISDSAYQKLEQGRISLTIGRASALAGMLGIPPEAIVSPLDGDDLIGEMELLRLYRRLTPQQRAVVLDVARNFIPFPHSQFNCESCQTPPDDG